MKKIKLKLIDWCRKRRVFKIKNACKLGIDIDGDIVVLGKRNPAKYYVDIKHNYFDRLNMSPEFCLHKTTSGISLLVQNNDGSVKCRLCRASWVQKR